MRAPEFAYHILRDLRFGLPVPEAVYAMGERMDGSGHPRGLKGDAIDANGRILAVVNAFCAMTSSRAYRAGMSRRKPLGDCVRTRVLTRAWWKPWRNCRPRCCRRP